MDAEGIVVNPGAEGSLKLADSRVVQFSSASDAAKENGSTETEAQADDEQSGQNNCARKPTCCCPCLHRVKLIHVVLCVAILAEWGLLTLPIVFFYIPINQESLNNDTVIMNASREVECFPYPTITSDSTCQNELTNTLLAMNCDPGGTPLVLRDAESTASQLLPLLQFLNPSPACSEAVVPFLCVFLFGLCDSSGVPIQPTSTQCEHIRDVLCREEWRRASEFLENIPDSLNLPDCGSFPAEQASCPASSGSGLSRNGLGIEDVEESETLVPTQSSTVVEESFLCADGFYREDGICLPSCHDWLELPRASSISIDVIISLTAFIGLVVACAVLVISFLKREKMFMFPSVLIVYKTIDVLVLAIFVLINYMDRSGLFCTSKNILESRLEVTPFCVISGMAFIYILMQLTVWWICHTAILFWKICFPFHSRRTFLLPCRVKCIHAACIVAALVIPLAPIVTSVIDSAVDLQSDASSNVSFLAGGLGYGQTRFPALLCSVTDVDAAFYSIVLPVDLTLAVGCSLLIVVLWTVHKQHGLFRARQSKSARFKIGLAERKLLIVVLYYVLLAVTTLTAFTITRQNLSREVVLILNYFVCEQNGHDPEAPCSRKEFESSNNSAFVTLSYIFLGLLPIVNLVYTLNIQELKKHYRSLRMKAGFNITDIPSTISNGISLSSIKKRRRFTV